MSQKKARLEKIYGYIKDQINNNETVPTQREIATDCNLALSTVQSELSKLEAQGRIVRTPYQSRSIRLISDEDSEENHENEMAEMVYDYLLETNGQGKHPTQQEIARACFVSRRMVREALLWLEAEGRIIRGRGQRNIRLPE